MPQARPASVATRNGVIAGTVLGILSLPVITFSAVGRAFGRLTALPTLFLLVAVVVFAVMGFLASRRNGLLRSGVWSGFLAGLITAFIGVCVGVVILTLLAPYAVAAAHAAAPRRTPRAALAILARVALTRLLLSGLALLAAGALAGLIGGALGRFARPGSAGGGQGAHFAPNPPTPQPFPFTPTNAHPFVDPNPTPLMGATPAPFYPMATPYDDSAPTTEHDSHA